AIAGNDDDGDFRMLFVDFAGQLHAVHAFHAKIGDQDVKVIFFELAQSIFAAVRADRTVTLHSQDFAAQVGQNLVIIHEEDRPHTASRAAPRAHRLPDRVAGALVVLVSQSPGKDARPRFKFFSHLPRAPPLVPAFRAQFTPLLAESTARGHCWP